jgi:hypothetical protein
MNDDGFEREVRDAAQRVADGRAPEALHARVAAIPATDRGRGGTWSRSGAATRVAASVIVMLVVAGVTLLIVTKRPDEGTVTAASGGTAPVTASPTTAPSTLGSVLATRTFGDLSIVMPADWQVVSPKVWTEPVGPRLFLSNAPISDPCPTAFAPGDACQKPLAALPPDGILVTFSGSATLGLSHAHTAVIVFPPTDTCAALGGERELGTGFAGFGVSACLRGPDLATNEALFRGLVASVHP